MYGWQVVDYASSFQVAKMSDKEWLKTQPAEILLEHCANFGVIAECECEAEVLAEECTEKRAEKIIEAQEEQLEHEESIFKFTIVLALGALAVTFACGYMLELNHIHRLPEAAVGLICGFLLSAGAYACGSTEMLSAEQFDFEFFMIWRAQRAGSNRRASSKSACRPCVAPPGRSRPNGRRIGSAALAVTANGVLAAAAQTVAGRAALAAAAEGAAGGDGGGRGQWRWRGARGRGGRQWRRG